MGLRTKPILKLAEKHAVDVDCEEADLHEDTTHDLEELEFYNLSNEGPGYMVTHDLEELEFYNLSNEGPGYMVDPDQLMNINNNNYVVQPPVDHSRSPITTCCYLFYSKNVQSSVEIY
ncbi:hypothetical protein QE152_g8240 [Popillia japonica]|uniref:Uncharacterized protein n=1 Tax=Popillia japonica TaxID=7064 RepID=A0AAW1MC73_POPJA